MTKNGPRGFDAYTTWNVQYSWDSKQVSVSGQITMPKVKSQCLGAVSVFKKYYRRLYQHELQHIEHGRWLCREMERVFQSAGSKSEADSQFMKLLAEANDKDKGYDSKTGHGDTEGVCFNSNCSNALFSATNSAFEKCLKSGNAQNKRKKRK